MNFIRDIQCEKGITLNSQLVDLLSILDKDIPESEQNQQITEYINSLKQRAYEHEKSKQQGIQSRYKYVLDLVFESIEDISPERKNIVKKIYEENLESLNLCDAKKMKDLLKEKRSES